MPPVSPKKAPVTKPNASKSGGDRPVLYPRYEVKICCCPADGQEYEGPITADIAKKLLRWETEPEYTKRMLASDPKMKESKAKFGELYILKNRAGEKVQCWNNAKNRPFDETHSRKLAQDTLHKQWEMNLENIIIGKTGIVLSGQHRLIGLIIAVEEYHATKLKNNKSNWQEIWGEEEPYIESCIAFGCKEDPRVVRTLDNVKARTLSDTIYTSPMFEKLDPMERKECSRYLDFAVDLLWKRTQQANDFVKYQTHSSSLDFLEKHPKLKAATKHLFDNNRDRVISLLGLSAGQSAGMLYLMGSSATESEDYYYLGSAKKESQLNWDNWDKALAFWTGLVDPKNVVMQPLRDALAGLRDPHTGATVPEKVKHMLLAMAWNCFVKDEEMTDENLDVKQHLKWSDTKERTIITEEPTVGGIDMGVVKGGGEEDEVLPTEEEQQEAKEREKQASLARMKDVVEKTKGKKEQLDDEEAPPNPLVEAKNKPKPGQKVGPVFSDEERQSLLSHVKPSTNGSSGGEKKAAPATLKAPKKPTLKR